MNFFFFNFFCIIAYEKERSDSNQKYKTVPLPSTVKWVQMFCVLFLANHIFSKNVTMMSLPISSTTSSSTTPLLPGKFLPTTFSLPSIHLGALNGLSRSLRTDAEQATSSTTTTANSNVTGHSSSDAIVID